MPDGQVMRVGCRTCGGDGWLTMDQLAERLGLTVVLGQDAHGFQNPCCHCNGDGKVACPCPDDKKDGDGMCTLCLDEGTLECTEYQEAFVHEQERTDCEYGYITDTCPHCSDKLDGSYFEAIAALVPDGDRYVCASYSCIGAEMGFDPDDEDGPAVETCPDCDGEGHVEVTSVKVGGREWALTYNSCSCCGARPRMFGDPQQPVGFSTRGRQTGVGEAWFVVRATLADSDCLYRYLCTSEDGKDGCLNDVLRTGEQMPDAGSREVAKLLRGSDDSFTDHEMLASTLGKDCP